MPCNDENMFLQFSRLYNTTCTCEEAQPPGKGGGSVGRPCPLKPTSISKPNKVQQFQFQTSGILLFMGVKKLCGPEISRLLHCRLKCLDTNYKRETDHFTLDVDHPKEDHNERDFKR